MAAETLQEHRAAPHSGRVLFFPQLHNDIHAAKNWPFSLFYFSQSSALLADGCLWACPALHKAKSSGLAWQLKEFKLLVLAELLWEDLKAHPFCKSPVGWRSAAVYQRVAPEDYGIFSVLSRPSRGHWSKPFTVGREKKHGVHVTVLKCSTNALVTHVSSMCLTVKESSNRLHFLSLSDTDSVKKFSSVCFQLLMWFKLQEKNAAK